MPRLNDAAIPAAQLQYLVGIGEVGSQRLLDQQIDPSRQQRPGSRRMVHRRDADRRSIHPARRGEASFNAVEAGNPELCGGIGQRSRVAVHNANKLDIAASLLKLAIDAQVVAPEHACADNDDVQWL
jgi:hypothetical protein